MNNCNDKIADLDEYDCPLVGRIMWEVECYDVQMVRMGCINENVLDFKLNRHKADSLCPNCPFNQLPPRQ
jgi:hypothetical protein